EMDDEGLEVPKKVSCLDSATADRDDCGLTPGADVSDEARLELAERGFAFALEEFPDRAVRLLDLAIDVVERSVEAARHLRTDRRLSGAHEPDEREVTT